jgi:cytidyltransferase-like protein
MKTFKQFFTEQSESKIVVIFPGRFQPFHIGHKKLYDLAKSKFPNADFYITTANPTAQQIAQEPDRYPFTFEEKSKIIQATGIPLDEIIQTSTPYIPKDLLSKYNPETDKVVFLVGEKDMKEDPRFGFKPLKSGKPSYYQPLQNVEEMVSFKDHGYIYAPSTITFVVNGKTIKSASELRNMFATGEEQVRKDIVTALVGKYNPEVYKILSSKLTKA